MPDFRANFKGNGAQLLNVHMETLTADPGSLVTADIGRFWFRSDLNRVRLCIAAGTAVSLRREDILIVNADVDPAAAIAYSKLNLTGNIVNADISGAAAIALSKLATDPLARANHTGTQLAATISNFDTQVRTSTLNQMTAPSADLSINSHKLINVTDGTASNDAATVGQLSSVSAGKDYKESVLAATTGSETYVVAGGAVTSMTGLSAGSTLGRVDQQEPVVGSRILIKNAPTSSGAGTPPDTQNPANGIYVVTGGTTTTLTVTRSTDADATAEVSTGMTTWVEAGTANVATEWTLNTPGPITLNTTAIKFAQTGTATPLSATLPLTLTGMVLALTYAAPLGLNGSNQLTITDPELSAIAGLVSAADRVPYFTGSGTAALATLTTNARSFLAAVTAQDQRTVLTAPFFTSTLLGDGVATSFTWDLSAAGLLYTTTPPNFQVWDVTTSTAMVKIEVDITWNSTTKIVTISGFLTPPASNTIRVTATG